MISKSQIFIAGGFGSRNACIFDLKNNISRGLHPMHTSRGEAGIYFDKKVNNVYIGGGNDFGVEYYDLNKNGWIQLAELNEQHKNYPIIWKSNDNNDVLYIASVENIINRKIERLDLRDNKNWQYEDGAAFELKIAEWINYESRLFAYSL